MKIAFLTAATSFVQTRVTSSLFTQTISDLLCTNSGSASNTEYNTFQSISYIQTITDVHCPPNIGLKFRICCVWECHVFNAASDADEDVAEGKNDELACA